MTQQVETTRARAPKPPSTWHTPPSQSLTKRNRTMTIVAQFSWDDIADPSFANPARVAWRSAVQEVAERATAALPAEVNGRIEKAVAIVLNGDVELLEGGKARVASQSNGTTKHVVCNGTCECRDFPQAHNG